jgi:hypothetical protein
MCSMRADPLWWQVGGGWAMEIETFLGSVKWHRADRRVPFGAQKSRKVEKVLWIGIDPIGKCHLGPKKLEISKAQPPPSARIMDAARINSITHGAI